MTTDFQAGFYGTNQFFLFKKVIMRYMMTTPGNNIWTVQVKEKYELANNKL